MKSSVYGYLSLGLIAQQGHSSIEQPATGRKAQRNQRTFTLASVNNYGLRPLASAI
jgi:hypothetical protein